MTRLSHRFSQRISIQSLLVLGIGLVTLALWMLPALSGNGSPYDLAICSGWTIALICLLMLNYRRAQNEETRQRTVYLDCTNHKLYNEKIGVVPYRNGCHLAEIMGSCFAKNDATTHPAMPDPSYFQLSAIIRTTAFDFQMNTPDPAFCFDNISISEWAGVIEHAQSGQTVTFTSLSQLEDLLCSHMQVDAISTVGRCPDAHTESCLCSERMIRSMHGSERHNAAPSNNPGIPLA